MYGLGPNYRFHLYNGSVDMRKGFDGLCGVIQNELKRTPTDGSAYVFINKGRDKMKILYWDGTGFWLYYKRLEAGRFEPVSRKPITHKSIQITHTTLLAIIEGITLKKISLNRRYNRT